MTKRSVWRRVEMGRTALSLTLFSGRELLVLRGVSLYGIGR